MKMKNTADMQKEEIIQRLRKVGCRITKQRLILLNIILEGDCSCSKEIYYRAIKEDKSIGKATVYRMIIVLEEIGAIKRSNMYKVECDGNCCYSKGGCVIELEDNTVCQLSKKQWSVVVQKGLKECGFTNGQSLKNIMMAKDA